MLRQLDRSRAGRILLVSSKCHTRLAAIAAVLWCVSAGAQFVDTNTAAKANSITGIYAAQHNNRWYLGFQYSYSGEPPGAAFRVELPPQAGTNPQNFQSALTKVWELPRVGTHVLNAELTSPGAGRSGQIIVSMVDASGKVLATAHGDQVIEWLSQTEQDLREAIALIDTGYDESLRKARATLERLVSENPKLDQGYVELARVAMKTNWGAEGLHQAETLLDSALSIRPDSANAKILLGYVYTHQQRFKEAEPLFVDAARSNPPNLWLWANWGELYVAQGKAYLAIAKYREAVARPEKEGNWNARTMAYDALLALLKQRKDYDGMEAVFTQRRADYGQNPSCFDAVDAQFRLNVRGDTQGAIKFARGALNFECPDDTPDRREILGLANYVEWARAKESESAAALNQARIYLPIGPQALYLLARSDKTVPAAKKLVATGEAIDQKDNEQMTALAHALDEKDYPAAERLLALGAHPDTPVSYALIPVALLPVMNDDVDGIRALQRAGVDYSKLSFRGVTALDYAKQTGNDELLEVLTRKAHTL
jgi:tetratricopeptide (TPR) repeat protein